MYSILKRDQNSITKNKTKQMKSPLYKNQIKTNNGDSIFQ